jgi:hypothetical protein
LQRAILAAHEMDDLSTFYPHSDAAVSLAQDVAANAEQAHRLVDIGVALDVNRLPALPEPTRLLPFTSSALIANEYADEHEVTIRLLNRAGCDPDFEIKSPAVVVQLLRELSWAALQ